MNTEPHEFFQLLCGRFLGLDPKLIRRLWGKLYPGEANLLAIQADYAQRSTGPEGVALLAQRLSPQLLLAACQRLSPAAGQRRDKAVILAEEAILAHVGPDGRWV
jgi:hypothetical protein